MGFENFSMFRLIIFGFSLLISIIAWPDQDKIPPLPLINFTVNFQQYSGYLQASATKRFHYWFTFSQRDYTRDPVILWLNGGPGCSSLEGLLEELGPFKIGDKASVVYANPYSWNKFASVVFIESPAGVGFSYSTDQNVTTDDDEVAQNNYDALVGSEKSNFKLENFRLTSSISSRISETGIFTLQALSETETFPILLTILGESYAGVYLPMVGAKIVKDKQNFPNFKGMAIGNGALNWPNNYGTMVPLYYYHALVRQELWDTIAGKCCNNDMVNCPVFTLFKTNPGCRTMLIELLDGTDELDPYNLYSSCYLDGSTNSKRNHIERHYRKMIDRPLRSIKKRPGVPLCAQDTNTETYLARRDVRQALHIPGLLPDWQECSDPVEQAYGTTHFDMTPEFLAVSDSGARVLVYNGDVDTVCNHVMNQNFLTNLNKTILGNETVNAAWYYAMETPNVAGFVTLYSGGIDYVTIRGSGHFVPEDKPKESLQMIYNWINKLDYSIPVPQF